MQARNTSLLAAFVTMAGLGGTSSTSLGCADGASVETSAASSHAITGGTPDDTNGATVYMVGTAGSKTGYCTGIVVSPHVVLTAAHCASLDATYKIFLGSDYNDAAQHDDPANFVDVTEHHTHPKWDKAKNEGDIGVLITTSPIPRTPAVMNRTPLVASDIGGSVRIVGFGQTVGGGNVIGRRNTATTTLAGYDATGLAIEGTPNICLYDSGGPTFMERDGVETVIGVHLLVSTTKCDGQGVDTRIDPFVDFVDEAIAKAEAPAVEPDAGASAGTDAAPSDPDPGTSSTGDSSGGCSVRAGGAASTSWFASALFGAVVFALLRLRRRRA